MPRPPRPPVSIVLGFKHTPLEFAELVIMLAQVCPKGFRNPRKKAGGYPTLVEQAAIWAGMMNPEPTPNPSPADMPPAAKLILDEPHEIPDKYLHSHARRRRAAEREATRHTEWGMAA
jgi:hypothetical protein